jgi:outer membrane protein assembly factor BamD (BamD/ComL family)
MGRNILAKKEVENGKLYIKLNQSDAALLYFDYVLETYPETEVAAEAKYYTATVYEKEGSTEEALLLYKELLEDSAWKEMAEKRIKEMEEKN